jgi:hypothetical protein
VSLDGFRLNCSLIGVHGSNVLVHELLLVALAEVCKDGRKVYGILVGVCGWGPEGLRLVEPSGGSIRCMWLHMTCQRSDSKAEGAGSYQSMYALVERYGTVLAYWVQHRLGVRVEWLHGSGRQWIAHNWACCCSWLQEEEKQHGEQ